MNHPFIQMLRFEYKANQKMWIITTTIGILLLALLDLLNNPITKPFSYSLFYLLTLIFTLLSYQESTNSQSMNMYHLIPVSQNIKYLSKIFITLIAFPVILFLFRELIITLGIGKDSASLPNGQLSEVFSILGSRQITNLLIASWFLSQSVSTLIAIIFKKYKILYALLFYWGLQLLMTPIVFLASFRNITGNSSSAMTHVHNSPSPPTWIIPFGIVISLVIYGISYRLFFRRQL